MGKFKLGDKVRVVGGSHIYNNHVYVGSVGTVIGISGCVYVVAGLSKFPEESLAHDRQYILNAIKRYEAIQ